MSMKAEYAQSGGKKEMAGFAPAKGRPPHGVSSSVDYVLRLQRTAGNRAVQRLFNSEIQAKLKIGPPNDIYEQQADRVADEVMRMPEPGIRLRPT